MIPRTTSGRNWHEIRMMLRLTDTLTSVMALGSRSFRRTRDLVNKKVNQTSRMTSTKTFTFTNNEIREAVEAMDVLLRVTTGNRRRQKIVRDFFASGQMKGNI